MGNLHRSKHGVLFISLSERSKKYCVTSLPWGLYRYNMLPMGLVIVSDVFQSEMGTLFVDMEEALVYIDDVLIIGTGSFEEHMETVNEV